MIKKEDVFAQLGRILVSSQISRSAVLTDFLSFVVNEALAGRSETLKEYTIGVQALKKDADFNPQIDSIVRIHAGRLRRALKEYYYEAGKDDPILISIPKGSYAPAFKLNSDETPFIPPVIDTADETSEPLFFRSKREHSIFRPLPGAFGFQNKVTVTVPPFKNIGSENELRFLAASIREYLSTELTQFHDIKVLVNPGSETAPLDIHQNSTQGSATNFALTGSVQWLKGRILVWIHLIATETHEQVWAQTFERVMPLENYYEFQQYVVDHVLAALMGLRGAISRYQINNVDTINHEPGVLYPLQYWYYLHGKNFNLAVAENAKLFYTEIVRKDPGNAPSYAYLSQIYSGELLMKSPDPERALSEGLVNAHKAIKCDPYCQEGYIALATNLLLRRNFHEGVTVLEQGARINPKNSDYKASMGALLIYMGYYDKGKEILDSVVQQITDLAWWQVLAFSYHSFTTDRFQDAIFWADRIEMNVEQISLIKAASFAYMDEYDRGLEALGFLDSDKSVEDLLSFQHLHNQFTLKPMAEKIQSGLRKLLQYKSVGAIG